MGLSICLGIYDLLNMLSCQCYTALLFSIKYRQKKLSTVCPGGFVSMDGRMHQVNQSLRLFHKGEGMMFPVEEICVVKAW
jgi:hypothetical protein